MITNKLQANSKTWRISNNLGYLLRVLQLAKAFRPISSNEEMGTKVLPTSRGGPSLTGMLISSYLELLTRSIELGRAIFTPATKAANINSLYNLSCTNHYLYYTIQHYWLNFKNCCSYLIIEAIKIKISIINYLNMSYESW